MAMDSNERRSALSGMAGIGVTALIAAVAGACVSRPRGAQASDSDELLTADSMIGKRLRVYHSGDPVTLDYDPDRLNIELGPDDRIVNVSLG